MQRFAASRFDANILIQCSVYSNNNNFNLNTFIYTPESEMLAVCVFSSSMQKSYNVAAFPL